MRFLQTNRFLLGKGYRVQLPGERPQRALLRIDSWSAPWTGGTSLKFVAQDGGLVDAIEFVLGTGSDILYKLGGFVNVSLYSELIGLDRTWASFYGGLQARIGDSSRVSRSREGQKDQEVCSLFDREAEDAGDFNWAH
jgi:hypothetical protein